MLLMLQQRFHKKSIQQKFENLLKITTSPENKTITSIFFENVPL